MTKQMWKARLPSLLWVAVLLALAAAYVLPAPVSRGLDQALSQAILERAVLDDSAFAVEAHHIFSSKTDSDGQTVTVYLVAAAQRYVSTGQGIEPDGGFYGVPTALTFSKGPDGTYALESYWEARDGALFRSSVRETFPAWAYCRSFGYPSGILTTICELQGWWKAQLRSYS